ncbi:hypothetical protein [Thermoflavimicrobium dichotomicum]|uniref:Uncharacterized protein n=1 Tax=Thermoflavimicrobium dichotomicum TaxID=46223 RepID=A0A1I3PUL3_9BACL|nr:hypothetical protein [Thermoflavimicrobium dichotomicum]SFJ24997.1 hypothetical protein SAMN05421852_106120 [Thermoflavimicrobium dichotomicum]
MSTLEEKIKDIKARLEKAKDLRYKAELRLETLEREEQKILQELDELGVKPDQLQEEIKRLEREIDEDIAQVYALLPEELRR